MSNGEAINEQLEFMERIRQMPPDDRSLEMARLTYTLTGKVDGLGKTVAALDTKFDECITGTGTSKKASALSGGLSGMAMAIIIGVIEYFRPR